MHAADDSAVAQAPNDLGSRGAFTLRHALALRARPGQRVDAGAVLHTLREAVCEGCKGVRSDGRWACCVTTRAAGWLRCCTAITGNDGFVRFRLHGVRVAVAVKPGLGCEAVCCRHMVLGDGGLIGVVWHFPVLVQYMMLSRFAFGYVVTHGFPACCALSLWLRAVQRIR
jgi:hypothetical protein